MASAHSILVVFIIAINNITLGYDEFYEELARRLLIEQHNETTRYIPSTDIYPPTQFEKIKGLFKSTIHKNIVGRMSYLRTTHQYPDNNFFVSTWIAHMLWEARSLNITQQLTSQTNMKINTAITDVIIALELFQNKWS